MNYSSYLISNFSTGLDKELQPWLTPDDSQDELFDGFVYLGVWQVRNGYTQLATGQRGGTPYCESRMVHRITSEVVGAANGMTLTFDHTASNIPLRRGSVTVRYTIGATPLIATDNGLGGFTGTSVDTALSTVNYTTGQIHIVFTVAPDNATNVTTTYDYHQGLPVMGVMNFFTQVNTRELIVADTTYINRFNLSTNRLDDITPTDTLTGNETNFLSWTMYKTANDLQRLLFVNYKDPVKQYSGSSISNYPIYTASNQQTAVASGVLGDGVNATFTINTPANTGIVPGTLTINETATPQAVTDDQFGNLMGDGIGTVDYLNGIINVTFNTVPPLNAPINLTYKQLTAPIESALHVFDYKDRCVVISTIENGIRYGLRLRISGTGAYSDVFTSDAIGAGLIDIPDSSFIQGVDFNRDDLIIFTNLGTWTMKYTQNDVVPFSIDKIDGTRGSNAAYGTITYLNRTNAISARGLILTDGYSVERSDNKIPQYSFNNVNANRYGQCFAGSVDDDRDHYLIHPSPGQQVSDVILVSNYEEDNYSVYRIPLSCMGEFINQYDVNWNDLLIYNTWEEMANVYKNWYSFAYTKGVPFSVGGGHHGQITRLNDTASEDYPVEIRDINVIDSQFVQITTDYQDWVSGDLITFDSIQGTVELNSKQIPISGDPIDHYNFIVGPTDTTRFNSYTSGGTASKVISFDTKTKKFNPFVNGDQKVRCGWIYFYVTTSGCNLTDNRSIIGATQSLPCVLNVPGHGYTDGTQVFVDGVNGMTELNGLYYYITVVDTNNISLNDVDSTGYSAYTTLGFTSTPTNAKLQVRVIVNDSEQSTQLDGYSVVPYEVNLSNLKGQVGQKTWYKIWVNQVGRFIQLQFGNAQAGADIQIHAVMPGFAGVGRMI